MQLEIGGRRKKADGAEHYMTGSLIGEILEAAITNKTSLAELLRMVKVAAHRLNLPSIEDWVSKELDGYDDGSDVPDYRRISGQVVAKHAMHGWHSIGGDPTIIKMLQERNLGGSIARLEAMLLEAKSSGNSGTFTMFLPADSVTTILGDKSFAYVAMGTRFPVASISAILDRVRGKILDWAIEMEKQGVVGQGMSFSAKEKEDAARATTNITFSGPVGTIAGNLGTGNSSGAITITGSNIAEALELVLSLQKNAQDLIKCGAHNSLSDALDNLARELALKSPDKGKLRSFADHVKTALAGASGNLLALGAMQAITQIGTLI
ncbi:hypothetical protein [Paracoccus sp. SY]|uniref:AbiTii domain-containing protein n=1 Tax=Paracoccus sp. SY TaxID=1330255 RepID=UPI0011AF082E|nr:hypothetical protein [Paracoccus sp. SY]